MKLHPAPRQRGFSLVEIALAIGVISFAVLGLLGLIASTQSVVRTSMDRTDNSLLFQKVVNQLKLKPFAKKQLASLEYPSVFPLPSLQNTATDPFDPFLVNERYDYVGTPASPEALAAATKIVRVVVLNSAELNLAGMRPPTLAEVGQLATVRIEISSPALAYQERLKGAPDKQIFYTEINLVEQ